VTHPLVEYSAIVAKTTLAVRAEAGKHVVATRSTKNTRARRIVGATVVGLALLGLLGACTADDAFALGWPRGVTPQGERMFDLWIGSVVAALVVGVFVWALIFWCIVRYRKRGEALPVQTRFNLPIELIYTVAPFLVISVLFYYTAVVQTDVNRTTPNPDVVVAVDAFKWNWKFSYPGTAGPDGQPVYTVGTSDYVPVLVLPTNKKIRFVEHSSDVIHSFWVPDMLFKRDVFPGNVVNQFETSILEEGAYVGRCAELCGTYHSMMNFEVRAVTPEKYTRFIAAKSAGQTTPQALTTIGESPLATTTAPFPTKREADKANS
jgi:cytochrome c oxidase subunit II